MTFKSQKEKKMNKWLPLWICLILTFAAIRTLELPLSGSPFIKSLSSASRLHSVSGRHWENVLTE